MVSRTGTVRLELVLLGRELFFFYSDSQRQKTRIGILEWELLMTTERIEVLEPYD